MSDNYGIEPALAPTRPTAERSSSQLEKATVSHVETQHRGGRGVEALNDAALMAGERSEKLTSFVVFLALTAAVSGFCFGYDTGVISAALVSIRDDLGHMLNAQEKEWISSATSVGALFG